MRIRVSRFALLLTLFAAPLALQAQDSASMTGVVTDATGAVIPDAVITLTNKQNGTTYTQKTDSKGNYHFLNVAPAQGYSETFTHPGFADFKIDNIAIIVGVTRTQNAKLSAGATAEVDVSARQETLNTTDATIGNNIDVEQLNELPVYDRTAGISTLFYLQPGVDSATGAVTGARIDQSSVTLDGLDVNDIAAGTTFAIVANAPVDSVEEFKGSVAGLQSALGTGSGGQFQLVTKSGTNKYHGLLYEYNRNTALTSNSYFNNLDGLARTPLIQNQFGGNIGGRVLRDKLFFFFDWADSRIIQSATGENTVPLPEFSAGNLNYINSGPSCGASSRANTTPSCITTLTSAQVAAFDPAGVGFDQPLLAFIQKRYPAPNDLTYGDGVNTGGFRFTAPTPDFTNTYVTRIDYNLNKKHAIFGRFTINRENRASLPVFPGDPATHPFIDHSYAYVVSDTWLISSNKVNQVYYGDTISKYDFPNAYNPTGADQFSLTGLSSPYSGNDGQKRRVPIPVVRDDFNWQLGGHSLVMGGTFKFIKTNSDLINNFNFVGVGQTSPALSGGVCSTVVCTDAPADLNAVGTAQNDYNSLFPTALGTIGSISTNYDYTNTGAALPAGSGSPRAYRYFETELYAGDTFKLNPKLTLSYGVRYQLYSVPYEAHGDESIEYTNTEAHNQATIESYVNARVQQASSPTPVLPIYSVKLGGKVNNGDPLYQPSYKDFAPRVAFAFSPYADGKTVFNGSAGIVYDRTVINAINFLQDQISYLFSNTQTNNIVAATPEATLAEAPRINAPAGATGAALLNYDHTYVPAPAAITSPYTPYIDAGGNPYGLAFGETNFVISPKLKDPYSIAFNVGVQQEMPFHTTMKLNYVGRLGRRLLADADAGQVIDVPDTTGLSNQTMAQAFAGLTTQLRAGANPKRLAPEPWFEDVLLPYGAAVGYPNNTSLVSRLVGQLGNRGDISDMLYTLAEYSYVGNQILPGFLPNNVGIPSQFGSNAYLNNQGNSNFHGLLLTLERKYHGLKYDFNYTWSHSIDNTSLSANGNALFSNSGFICDILRPRACRGSSDFDVRQEINGDAIYELPIGHSRQFLTTTPRWVDELVGGWAVSGIPTWRTGLAVTPYSDAYLASFDNQDPAIFTGTNPGDLKVKPNLENGVVYGFPGGQAGANKVLSEFRGPIGLEYGQRNLVRGPGYFNLDAGLAKTFPVLPNDNLNVKFRADFFNILNHSSFSNPGLNIVGNASQFGQITNTVSNSVANYRVGELSLRVEF
jgi:hypothetical protein